MKFLSLFILLSLLVGCAPGAALVGGVQPVQSKKPRAVDPQVAEEDQAALAAGNTAFALDMYRMLGDEAENLFFSPYSISLALAMTYAGARGDTDAQMADALHFTLPPEQLHPAFNAVDQALASRKEVESQGADGKGFRLNIVNDLWGQKDYTFLPDFLDLLSANYGAGLRLMNFSQDPEGSRRSVNEYIEKQTEQRIKDLLPEESVNPLTRLILTNAIYFNAAWQHTFEKNLTKDAPFNRLDGSQVTVRTMEMSGYQNFLYADGDGFQAIALPYENTDLHMLILIPDAGQYEAFEDGLDAARLEEIISQMQYRSVRVLMPKFKVEGSFSLSKALSELGMQDAFSPEEADFSGMNGERDLFISDVIHKSFVNVDEQGTEAAAATAVIMETASMPMDTLDLTIDRPFIFMVQDQPTNALLFLGRVLAP